MSIDARNFSSDNKLPIADLLFNFMITNFSAMSHTSVNLHLKQAARFTAVMKAAFQPCMMSLNYELFAKSKDTCYNIAVFFVK